MTKIQQIIVSCVKALDHEAKTTFWDREGFADLKKYEIFLPNYEYNVGKLLMIALHELAHLWYSRKAHTDELNQEEREVFFNLDEVYADYHFCKDHPEFALSFNRRYQYYQEEFEEGGGIGDARFWLELRYAIWDARSSFGMHTWFYRQFTNIDLIQKLHETITSAKSSQELIPAAKKHVLQIQNIKKQSENFNSTRMVGSWGLDQLDTPSQYLDYAQAFLDCAIHCCQGIINNSLSYTYPHGMVLLSTFFHSVELFYKGAILQATDKMPSFGDSRDLHSIIKLHNKFREYYSEEDFPFQNPIGITPLGSLEKGFLERTIHLGRIQDQKLRYPTDKEGVPWSGASALEVESFKKKLMDCKEDYNKLIPLIKKAYKQK